MRNAAHSADLPTRQTWICALLAWLPAWSCSSSPTPTENLREQIEARHWQLISLGERGHGDAATAMHAVDAVLMPPAGEVLHGRYAVRELMSMPDGMEIRDNVIETALVDGNDQFAIHAGTYSYIRVQNGRETPARGRFVMAWKKVDGEWKVIVDMWDRSRTPLSVR